MPQFDLETLNLFTGTERYYRISRKHLLTDGTKYLAGVANSLSLITVSFSFIYA